MHLRNQALDAVPNRDRLQNPHLWKVAPSITCKRHLCADSTRPYANRVRIMSIWVLSGRSADLYLPRRIFRLSSEGVFCVFIVINAGTRPRLTALLGPLRFG
jgi:hypothetical protein